MSVSLRLIFPFSDVYVYLNLETLLSYTYYAFATGYVVFILHSVQCFSLLDIIIVFDPEIFIFLWNGIKMNIRI